MKLLLGWHTSQNQSVAAFVAADKVAFYHCAFYSTHETIFDYKGKHYYDICYIQGSIDFIFGRERYIFFYVRISCVCVCVHNHNRNYSY